LIDDQKRIAALEQRQHRTAVSIHSITRRIKFERPVRRRERAMQSAFTWIETIEQPAATAGLRTSRMGQALRS
jgi:hypothetical protein